MKVAITKKNTIVSLDILTGKITNKRKEFVQVDLDSAFKAFKSGKDVEIAQYSVNPKITTSPKIKTYSLRNILKVIKHKNSGKAVAINNRANMADVITELLLPGQETYKYNSFAFFI